ncbi:MAG: hypothetical protein GXP26_14160 [Planctomycetes bacterium]|nr:hypothetical protein [Planctomycetota bacterium]
MTPKIPHYLLFSEASRSDRPVQTWRFVLQNVETQRRFSATDTEPIECSERLELLAVVRGLESLDGPARVTLVTKSRYVSRGLKSGLAQWRLNDWCWERFGRIVPVRDHDLWRRVDRALQYHTVNCQAWHFDEAAEDSAAEVSPARQRVDLPERVKAPKYSARRMRRVATVRQRARSRTAQPTPGAIETVWTNVKSLAQSIAQPTLEPTA